MFFTLMLKSPLEVFKVRLDGALSNLIWWKMSLHGRRGWTRWSSKVPSNPPHSVILNERS